MIESIWLLSMCLIIFFIASFIQGITSFGFALISAPLLMIIISPNIAIPIIIMNALIINTTLLIEVRKGIDLRIISPLIVGGIIGLPIGTYLLIFLDVGIIKIIVGIIIITFSICLIKGYRKKIRREKLSFGLIGISSGILQSSTSMSGPPVILSYTNQNFNKKSFRANIVGYFWVLNLATIPVFYVSNIINLEVTRYAINFIPITIIGVIIGIKLSSKIKEKIFQKIVLIIVSISGLLSLTSGLGFF